MVNMVADPKTGKVTPSTNNEAVTTVFEPGSVNKVITVSEALGEGKVTPATVDPAPLGAEPRWRRLHRGRVDAEPAHGHRHPHRVLQHRHDRAGPEDRRRAGRRGAAPLRLRPQTALDFPNESAGLLLPLDQWSGSSIGSIPIGQGISVTAMQMLRGVQRDRERRRYAVPPKLVTATIDAHGRAARGAPRRQGTGSSRAHVATQVRGMLANVVTSGTGEKAAVPGYQVAGKTGTARKPLDEHLPGNGYMDLNGHYHYVSTFVGMLARR